MPVLLVLDAAWVATRARDDLNEARAGIVRGADALVDGRLDDARGAFGDAERAADGASGMMSHPAGAVAGWIGPLADDVAAIRGVANASALVARAGLRLADAAERTGWNGAGASDLGPGSLDLEGLRSATRPLEDADALLADAAGSLSSIRTDGLVGSIRDGVTLARSELAEKRGLVRSAVELSRVLPGFLGGDGPRRYALLTLSLADPRGSGGYPGAYGILRADGGSLELTTFGPTASLGVVPPVSAGSQGEDQARYERFGARTHFIATTYSPDFAASARQFLRMWEASGREPLDGVIAVDSVWMSYVLAASGPVETDAWAVPITAENVSDVLDRETYLSLDAERSNQVQNAIAASLWQALLERPLAGRALADALARGTRERHLQVYAVRPEEEATFERLDAAGRVEIGEVPVLVAWDGAVASRAGYFAERSVAFRAVLAPDGSAHVRQTITLTNGAPTGPPSILVGGFEGDVPAGHYESYVNTYLPARAEGIDVRGGALWLVEREFDVPVVLGLIGASSGGTASMEISYDLPAPSERGRFRVDVTPLPALRADDVSVEIVVPAGTRVLGASPGAGSEGSSVRWSGAPTEPTAVWVAYGP
jgi:hypothetical protein